MAQEQRLALIEILERDGRVRQQASVAAWPVSIGRALDNDLVLEDPHVAAHHAALETDADGRLWLAVGETTNGVRLGRHTHAAGARFEVTPGAPALQLGQTRLRLRRAGEALAPEKPLAGLATPRAVALTVLFTLLLWGVTLAQQWVDSDPGTPLTQWLPTLVGLPGAIALWCAAWALASKLFQHRFEFGVHWAHAVRWLLGITLAGWVLNATAAALALPQLFRWVGVVELLLAAVWLWGHARLVLPAHPRGLAVSFGAAAFGGLAVMMVLNLQREERLVGPLYMHQLPYAGIRWARPEAPARFVERSRALKETLDRRARKDADDEPAEGEEPGS